MHTPSNLTPSKDRKIRERVVRNLPYSQFSFSVQTPRSSSHRHKSPHNNESLKRHNTTICSSERMKVNIKNLIQQQKYQFKVQKALKKSANLRFSIDKSFQYQLKDSQNNYKTLNKTQNKRFLLEGEHFDLKGLRFKNEKTKQKKTQIKKPHYQETTNHQPIMLVGKCKLNNKLQNWTMNTPFLRKHSYQKTETSLIEKDIQNLDAKQFLKCYRLQSLRDSNNDENPSFALNNQTMTNYLKDSKIRKYFPDQIEKESTQYLGRCNNKRKCSAHHPSSCNNHYRNLESALRYKDRRGTKVTESQIESNQNLIMLKGWDSEQADQSVLGQITLPNDYFIL